MRTPCSQDTGKAPEVSWCGVNKASSVTSVHLAVRTLLMLQAWRRLRMCKINLFWGWFCMHNYYATQQHRDSMIHGVDCRGGSRIWRRGGGGHKGAWAKWTQIFVNFNNNELIANMTIDWLRALAVWLSLDIANGPLSLRMWLFLDMISLAR